MRQIPVRLDLPLITPSEQLACDEAMLDYAEETDHPGFLRFFEARDHFVVLGYGKKAAEEVFEQACLARGIPILRRCSGGGTVVQGPGCFNFSLVLPIDSKSGLETIAGSNRLIMAANRDTLAGLLGRTVEIQGVSDLTIDGIKFSGNAQRRKKRCLLFHGSFLLNFDLNLISELLRPPARQPEYRANREHGAFLRNIGLDQTVVGNAIAASWNAIPRAGVDVEQRIRELTIELARAKYSTDEWNHGA
jgi:lipoate-protein ligase A